MTTKKVVWFCWGAVYWPFILLGIAVVGVGTGIYTIGEWLHDLLLDWVFPLPKPLPLTVDNVLRDSEIKRETK